MKIYATARGNCKGAWKTKFGEEVFRSLFLEFISFRKDKVTESFWVAYRMFKNDE